MFDQQCLIVWPGPYKEVAVNGASIESSSNIQRCQTPVTQRGEGDFFHSTWECTGLEGILFRPFSLAMGILFFHNFVLAKGTKFSDIDIENCHAFSFCSLGK